MILAISLVVILDICTGSLIPMLTNTLIIQRDNEKLWVNQIHSSINITDVSSGAEGVSFWWNTSFGFRKFITIDSNKIAGAMSNYPLYIDITDSDLKYQVLQSNGNDIAFTDHSQTEQFNHQIERYESTTGHLVAWVNMTYIEPETAHETLYMYYGNATCENQQNPSGVWDGNFHGVWHLNETSGTLADSTSYENDGTAYNTPTYDAEGTCNGAMDFDGSSDYVSCGDPVDGSLDFGTGDFTLECWVKTAQTGERNIISKSRYPAVIDPGYILAIEDGYLVGYIIEDSGFGFSAHSIGPSSIAINDNQWHHVAITFDRDFDAYYYIDGQIDANTPVDISGWDGTVSGSESVWFARRMYMIGPRYSYFDGVIDEIRLSNMFRQSWWINTSYVNQKSPSTFYTLGDQTTRYPTITVENIGSTSLLTSDFTLLINGTSCDFTRNCTYLLPLNEVSFYPTTIFTSGEKRIKIIADTGVEDYYIMEK